MRDQFDSQVWNDHHRHFSDGVARTLAGLGSGLPRRLPRMAPQLIAATAAVGLTLVTFTGAAA